MIGCDLLDFGKPARQNGKRLPCERLMDENARLHSCLSDDADNARQIMGENAKLYELAHLVAEYTSADQCEGCIAKRVCHAGELDMCWIRKAILEKLRELGVEVDG